MKKIIGERLKRLLRDKKVSQERFAELVGVKREVISQLCNDKYKHVPKQATLDRIYSTLYNLGYGDAVHLYLSGEAEYNDINTFGYDSSPARAYRATEMISDILNEMEYSALLDDRRYVRVYGKDKIRDYLDMNAAEYKRFEFYILDQIKAACDSYIAACYTHDETLASKHEVKNVSEHFDPVNDLHYYPDK